jgi:sensor histidine kinase YesM
VKKKELSKKKIEDYFKKIPIKFNRVVLVSVAFFALVFSIVFLGVILGANYRRPDDYAKKIEFYYTETNIDEVANDSGLWENIRIDGGEIVTFTGTFSQMIDSNLHVFYQNLNVRIYVNNTLIITTEGQPSLLSNSPGIGWLSIEHIHIDPTDIVRIEMSCPYSGAYVDQYLQTLNNIYSGNDLALMNLKLSENIFAYIAYIFSMVVGVFCILTFMLLCVSKQKQALHFLLIGFTLLLCGVWTAPQEYISLYLNNPVLYASLYTSVLPLIMILVNTSLLLSYEKPTRLMYIYTIVIAAILTILIILQLSGVADIYEFTVVGGIGCAIDICIVSYSLFKNYETFDEKQRKLNLFKYLPIVACAIVDITMFIFTGKFQSTFLRLGMVLFTMVSTFELFIKFREASELQLIGMQLALDVQKKENELLLHQIQPHFLFNSLNCISTLCQVDPEKAEKAVIYFSNYLRNNMELINSTGNTTFEKEMNHIEQYLMLHEIRFEDDIVLDINNPCGDFEIPPLSIEPIVENAINYAFRGYKIKLKIINIDVKETIGGHIITIADNGKGFNVERIGNDGKKHIGMENVKNRIEKSFGGSMDIFSETNKGTIVTLFLPTIEKEDNI